ncbi:hypothetical protein F5Y18DRAFT_190336 [Xylariaceae sp. FL1019]|nr:hypothetical protein F5Y18DRAFT_190336 [Xylariaceae sp. FL1019]
MMCYYEDEVYPICQHTWRRQGKILCRTAASGQLCFNEKSTKTHPEYLQGICPDKCWPLITQMGESLGGSIMDGVPLEGSAIDATKALYRKALDGKLEPGMMSEALSYVRRQLLHTMQSWGNPDPVHLNNLLLQERIALYEAYKAWLERNYDIVEHRSSTNRLYGRKDIFTHITGAIIRLLAAGRLDKIAKYRLLYSRLDELLQGEPVTSEQDVLIGW